MVIHGRMVHMDKHIVVVTEPSCWDGKYRYHEITQSTYPLTGWIVRCHETLPELGYMGYLWGGGKVLNLLAPVATVEEADLIARRFWLNHLREYFLSTKIAHSLDQVIART